MGNRAYVAGKGMTTGFYFHWNGGLDSIQGLITYARLAGIPTISKQEKYITFEEKEELTTPEEIERETRQNTLSDVEQLLPFFQMVQNVIGSAYFATITDNSIEENGRYIIDKNWEICERILPHEGYTEQQNYDLVEFVEYANSRQPQHAQLPEIVARNARTATRIAKRSEIVEGGEYVFIKRNWNHDGPETEEICLVAEEDGDERINAGFKCWRLS